MRDILYFDYLRETNLIEGINIILNNTGLINNLPS